MFDSSLKMWILECHYFSCWPESYVYSELFEPLQFWESQFIHMKLLEQKRNKNKLSGSVLIWKHLMFFEKKICGEENVREKSKTCFSSFILLVKEAWEKN